MPDTETETSGYILMMALFGSGNFQIVYDGENRPQTLEYTVTGLFTGLTYQFKLIALNFNGQS